MRDLRDKNVVVTGAASGIGKATAELLAKRGARLYLCDLDEAKLKEAATICSGIIDTNIVQTTRYKRDADATRERIVSLYKKRAYPADKVASAVVSAIEHERAVVPVSPEAWAAYWLKRFAPSLAGVVSRVAAKHAAPRPPGRGR